MYVHFACNFIAILVRVLQDIPSHTKENARLGVFAYETGGELG